MGTGGERRKGQHADSPEPAGQYNSRLWTKSHAMIGADRSQYSGFLQQLSAQASSSSGWHRGSCWREYGQEIR